MAEENPSRATNSGDRKQQLPLLVVTLLALVYLAFGTFRRPVDEKSIDILPFERANQAALAALMAERDAALQIHSRVSDEALSGLRNKTDGAFKALGNAITELEAQGVSADVVAAARTTLADFAKSQDLRSPRKAKGASPSGDLAPVYNRAADILIKQSDALAQIAPALEDQLSVYSNSLRLLDRAHRERLRAATALTSPEISNEVRAEVAALIQEQQDSIDILKSYGSTELASKLDTGLASDSWTTLAKFRGQFAGTAPFPKGSAASWWDAQGKILETWRAATEVADADLARAASLLSTTPPWVDWVISILIVLIGGAAATGLVFAAPQSQPVSGNEATLAAQLRERTDSLRDLQTNADELRKEIDHLARQHEGTERRLAQTESDLIETRRERDEIHERLRSADLRGQEHTRLSNEIEALRSERDSLSKRLVNEQSTRKSIEQELKKAHDDAVAQRAESAALVAERDRRIDSIDREKAEVERISDGFRRQFELEKARAEEAAVARETAERRYQDVSTRLADLQSLSAAERRSYEMTLNRVTAEKQELQDKITSLQSKMIELQTKSIELIGSASPKRGSEPESPRSPATSRSSGDDDKSADAAKRAERIDLALLLKQLEETVPQPSESSAQSAARPTAKGPQKGH